MSILERGEYTLNTALGPYTNIKGPLLRSSSRKVQPVSGGVLIRKVNSEGDADECRGTYHHCRHCKTRIENEVQHEEENGCAIAFVSVAMGLVFGAAMERGKVTLPVVIREQFLFERWIMLKMFLAAAASSALVLCTLSVWAPPAFERARHKFMGCGQCKGLMAVAIGAMVLGAGMAVAGACPGMVLVQVGSGVPQSGITLAGGLAAAIVYGLAQPRLAPFLAGGACAQQKLDDFGAFKGLQFWQLALPLVAALTGVIVVLEVLVPWRSAWPPALSGALIGALQVPAVVVVTDTLGSTSSYMTCTAQLLAFSTAMQARFSTWNGFRLGPGNWWQLLYVCAAILGAFTSASIGGSLGKPAGVPAADAFVGGFLMILGSTTASGCTSGHGISGLALLSLNSWVAVPMMFAGGIATSFLYQAASPSFTPLA